MKTNDKNKKCLRRNVQKVMKKSKVNRIAAKTKGSLSRQVKISEAWLIMLKSSEIRENETKIKLQKWRLESLTWR